MKANILDLNKAQEVWIILGFALYSASGHTRQTWTVGYFLDKDKANEYLDDLRFGLDLAGITQNIYYTCPGKTIPNDFLDKSAIHFYCGYGIHYCISSAELIE